MTFNPVAAINVLECRNIISNDKAEAIDLGSQTASINNTFISNLINQNRSIKKLQKKKFREFIQKKKI